MKIGAKYFDDIEARIPREEIDEYDKILKVYVSLLTIPGNCRFLSSRCENIWRY